MSEKKKILIVEDDLALHPLWMAILRRCAPSAHVDWAVSCEVAQAKIREAGEKKSPFDLVIADLFLAGSGTGADLLSSKEIRQMAPATMLVSIADKNEMRDYFKKLPDDTIILTKPIHLMKCEAILGPVISGLESSA